MVTVVGPNRSRALLASMDVQMVGEFVESQRLGLRDREPL
jgi:hypothetical protein